MKIISNKKWEEMEQKLVDLQLDLSKALDDEQTYLKQINYLQKELENEKTASNAFSNVIEEYFVKIESQKDTIRKLKTLLTKNKIDYKTMLEKKKVK